eukprot:TRINITY_DN30172_c0_g1_i1.p1 TRINITY_DN30172_c0_g1~~TRINITY_DN30172_c0_g1_i1.p1  ORF type:complete len:175 (+),score=30.69 TRINITY_DN30172_c0_g1_i1:52-576(+)
MEWRAFYQVPSSDKFARATGYVEERTDVYIAGVGVDKGLKIRGGAGELVEVKVRGRVDENGVEKWRKHKRSIHSIGDVVPALKEVPVAELRTITVQKSRFAERIPQAGAVEVANLTVPPHAACPAPAYWVSYCIEGWMAPSQAEIAAVQARLPPGALVGGYPTWIEALAGGTAA